MKKFVLIALIACLACTAVFAFPKQTSATYYLRLTIPERQPTFSFSRSTNTWSAYNGTVTVSDGRTVRTGLSGSTAGMSGTVRITFTSI